MSVCVWGGGEVMHQQSNAFSEMYKKLICCLKYVTTRGITCKKVRLKTAMGHYILNMCSFSWYFSRTVTLMKENIHSSFRVICSLFLFLFLTLKHIMQLQLVVNVQD